MAMEAETLCNLLSVIHLYTLDVEWKCLNPDYVAEISSLHERDPEYNQTYIGITPTLDKDVLSFIKNMLLRMVMGYLKDPAKAQRVITIGRCVPCWSCI